jgi:membrane protein DedA with SNARE-associated domain
MLAGLIILVIAALAVAAGIWDLGHGHPMRGLGKFLFAIGPFLHGTGPFPSLALLYIEESGVPLFVPGDVFVLYSGSRVPHNVFWLLAIWLGLIGCVTLGATNLYVISRRWGRRLVEGRTGAVFHITPARLARAERWFARWGVMALIVGRHIPGFRVPLTVAAGVSRFSYAAFAASVGLSTAIWAGVLLLTGFAFGGPAGRLFRRHPEVILVILALLIVTATLVYLWQRRSRTVPDEG